MAERLCLSLAQKTFSRDVVVTASFRFPSTPPGECLNDLIQRVEQTQYQVKKAYNCGGVDEAEA